MSTIHIRLYDVCRKNLKLEETAAKEVVEAIQDVVKVEQAEKHKHLEEIVNKDIRAMAEHMSLEFKRLREYMDQRFAHMDGKTDQRFVHVENRFATKDDMAKELSTLRSELLRTIYLTSLGQLIAIIASVISLVLILKK